MGTSGASATIFEGVTDPDHIALAADGAAVWVGRHGAVACYEPATARLLARVPVDLPVEGVALRPDGRVLDVAGRVDAKRTVLSVRTLALPGGAVIAEWTVDVNRSVGARLVFAPDGRSLGVAGLYAHLFPLDERGALLPARSSYVGEAPLAFDPRGRFLACGAEEGARLVDLRAGDERRIAVPRERVVELAFSADGARLAIRTTPAGPSFLSRGQPDRILVADTEHAQVLASWVPPPSSWGARLSADGARVELALGKRDAKGELAAFDAMTGAPLGRRERAWAGDLAPPEPLEPLRADGLAFHAGLLLTRSGAHVRAWDLERRVEVRQLPAGTRVALHPPDHDPARGLLARAVAGGRTWRSMGDEHDVYDVLELADLETGRTLVSLGTEEGLPVLFTGEGLLVCHAGELRVLEPARWERITTLAERGWVPSSSVADSDGWLAALGRRGRDPELRVYALRSGALVSVLPLERALLGDAPALALHRAADRLAIGTSDGRVVVARASDGAILATERRHWRAIRALAFDEPGARLASACYGDVVLVRETPAADAGPRARPG